MRSSTGASLHVSCRNTPITLCDLAKSQTMQTRVLYTFWFLFAAIYCLQGAATGKLLKAPRSKQYWPLSGRNRFLCLIAGIVCVVGTVLTFISIFPPPY